MLVASSSSTSSSNCQRIACHLQAGLSIGWKAFACSIASSMVIVGFSRIKVSGIRRLLSSDASILEYLLDNLFIDWHAKVSFY